ncbi:SWIM zinc finger family protein [Kineosporia sp. R_H_3]|uniref:SWIM zinc finger family protein n=1 Tax=Kineosporia sp. R_H_3 TaxID=1961848 RepID=UPI000B4BEBB2|nr:SWIM zinc finger family protein [Kineosporia sp. R_H_3]
MGERWSTGQVAALAPDASSAAAGRTLASPSTWSGLGACGGTAEHPAAVWGLCRGSGKNPYQTVVDVSGPAYRCSCPSRKFPCKHALGLLLLWAAGSVPDADAPADFAVEWLRGRVERAAKAQEPAARAAGPVDAGAAARRAERREDRVRGGLVELGRWLEDQVRRGLAGAERAGYAPFEQAAARLVDAQAPGLAAWVRALPGVVASGPGWPGRLLEEYALMHLLVRAHENLDALPAPLAATVRRRVGYPVSRESVLAGPAVRDRWTVLGLRDDVDDRLVSRRIWLRGSRTGRDALVLSFAGPGAVLDTSLVPGTSVEADVHLYPDAAPLRALVGPGAGAPGPAAAVAAGSVADGLAAAGAALAADPWTTSWPLVLTGVVVDRRVDGTWWLVDGTGALPLAPVAGEPWVLLARSGGRPLPLLAEWTPRGAVPVAPLPGGPPAAAPTGAGPVPDVVGAVR